VPELRRIGVLLLTQATSPHPLEDRLLRNDVAAYYPAPSTYENLNSTNVADLASGVRAFHKPLLGVNGDQAKRYGHDSLTVAINECAAWRLARFLGSPYDSLVPTTVLRFHPADDASRLRYPRIVDGWGSLASEQPGRSADPAPLDDPGLTDPAAFFDALIAQQDRHIAQYRWDAAARRLGLIDHGFAFARPGDPLNASVFLDRRHGAGGAALQPSERAALQKLEREDLIGLRDILEPGQADALAARVERMLSSGRVIEAGDW